MAVGWSYRLLKSVDDELNGSTPWCVPLHGVSLISGTESLLIRGRIMLIKKIAVMTAAAAACLASGVAVATPSEAATSPVVQQIRVSHLDSAQTGAVVPFGYGIGDDVSRPTVMHAAPNVGTNYVGTAQPGNGQSIADICTEASGSWYMTIERNGVLKDHRNDTAAFIQAGDLIFRRSVPPCEESGLGVSLSNGQMFSAPWPDSYTVGSDIDGDSARAFCTVPGQGSVVWVLVLVQNGVVGKHFADTAAWIPTRSAPALPSCD